MLLLLGGGVGGGGRWVGERVGRVEVAWPSSLGVALMHSLCEAGHSVLSQGSDATGMHQDHRPKEPWTQLSSKFYEA